jgi:hypothetical protein
MIDEYGPFGGMKIGRGNQSTRRKPAPAPLCPPQIPHDLAWTTAMGSRRLTATAMARTSLSTKLSWLRISFPSSFMRTNMLPIESCIPFYQGPSILFINSFLFALNLRSSSRKGARGPASQKIRRPSWEVKVHCHIHKNPVLVPILRQMISSLSFSTKFFYEHKAQLKSNLYYIS